MVQTELYSTNLYPAVPLVVGVQAAASAPPSSPQTQLAPLSPVHSAQFDPEHFSEWLRESGNTNTLVFRARHLPSGKQAILRLLPWMVTDDQKEKCRQALRLIEWLGPKFGADHIDYRLDDSPPSIFILRNDLPLLTNWLPQANVQQRLQLACNLIEAISKARSMGLQHGKIDEDCVHVDCEGSCFIDYLLALENPNAIQELDSLDDDFVALNTLIQKVVASCADDQGWMATVTSLKRARLRHLLTPVAHDSGCQEAISRWQQLLSELYSNNGAITNNTPSQGNQRGDQHNKADDQSRDRRVAPASVRAEFPSDDQTCEVDVVQVQIDGKTDDSTDEIDLSEMIASHPAMPRLPQPGETLGRFQLIKQIGHGGMGVVFEGLDIATQQRVAIKILRVSHGDLNHAIRRFRKEARLLQSIRNDFVTQLIETGEDHGLHYLAMEFVEGTNLRDWLSTRESLDETTALRLAADIARALVDAHQQDTVHRDIKPENVLLARLTEGDEAAEQLDITQLRVKLSDFGIARQIRQSESMEMTRAGAMIGTPTYMSPEQCKSTGEIGPTSDVYSLGVLLYRLLTGELPFESDDPIKLVAMHCFDPPPPPQKRNRMVSDATADLVFRMLAKDPGHRPADAGQLLAEIERLLRGEPSQFEAHPHLPVMTEKRVWKRVFEWELASSAEELWPFVSNTERLNRAIGLSSVKYRTEKDPRLGLRKFGSFKLAGMSIEWEEHPFEWIEGARMGVLREFATGPFLWFSSIVELVPLPTGGTRLIHTVRIEPRNIVGRAVATIEAGWKGGKSLDRVYRRIDNWIQNRQRARLDDPYETPKGISRESERRLTQRIGAALNQNMSPELADKLADFLRTASPQTLARIRPLDLADLLNEPSEAVLDACLIAARNQLLVMRWDILCPSCRAPASSVSWLNDVNQHTGCEACDTEFQSNLANAIELVFEAHPDIRQVDSGKYCIGGPEHSPHVVTQLRLAPDERIEIVVPISPGDYLLRGPRLAKSLPIRARARAAPSRLDVKLSQLESSTHTPVVRSGRVAFHLTNDFDTPQVVRIERTIQRSNVVTAAAACAIPKFRELFPDQVFRRDIPVATEELTFLAVRILDVDAIYAQCSETEAYLLIQKAMNAVEQCIAAHRGAVIKSVGESLMATFQSSCEAVQTAFKLPSQLREIPEVAAVELCCGVHRGSALVTTQNGRLDYFGTTARTVESLVSVERPAVVLTDAVFADPDVSRWLADVGLDSGRPDSHVETMRLPGGNQRLIQTFITNTNTTINTP